MLKGLRWTLLAVGLAAFLAALLLVVATSDPPPRDLWWLLTTIAVLGTASLAVTFWFGTGVSRRSRPPPQPRSTGDGSGSVTWRGTRKGISGALILLCLIAGGAAVLWALGFGGTELGGRIRPPLRVDVAWSGPSLAILLSAGLLLAALGLWPAPRPAPGPDRRVGVPPARGPDDELFRVAFRDVVDAASPRSPTA